jgi:hypothetical protein
MYLVRGKGFPQEVQGVIIGPRNPIKFLYGLTLRFVTLTISRFQRLILNVQKLIMQKIHIWRPMIPYYGPLLCFNVSLLALYDWKIPLGPKAWVSSLNHGQVPKTHA